MSELLPGTTPARLLPWLLLLSACGAPTVYDVDLEPVRDPALVAELEGGRLAVDTTAGDPRAILELYVEAGARERGPPTLPAPWLRCAREGAHPPMRVRWGERICSGAAGRASECRVRSEDPSRCRAHAPTCYYVLRAEYRFDHVPDPGESITLGLGPGAPAVRWVRR